MAKAVLREPGAASGSLDLNKRASRRKDTQWPLLPEHLQSRPLHPRHLLPSPPASPPGAGQGPDLTPGQASGATRTHLELHAARAAVQTVQQVLQETLAAAQGFVGDLWEALS